MPSLIFALMMAEYKLSNKRQWFETPWRSLGVTVMIVGVERLTKIYLPNAYEKVRYYSLWCYIKLVNLNLCLCQTEYHDISDEGSYTSCILLCFFSHFRLVSTHWSPNQHDTTFTNIIYLRLRHGYRQISNIRGTKSQNLNDSHLVLRLFSPSLYWSHVFSREWRCSWSSADRRCSNYIWVINNLIAYKGALILEIWR